MSQAEPWFLGIDVGGTKIAAGLVNRVGRIEDFRSEPTDQSADDSVVRQLHRLLQEYATAEQVAAAGIGIPGIADPVSGLVWAPNLRGWDYIPLHRQLAGASGLPIVIESDRNTAVLGELRYGGARRCSDVVYLILGTGIGAGIFSGGRLVRGRHEIAGAVGWIPVEFGGTLAHFEDVASGPAILRHAGNRGLPEEVGRLTAAAEAGETAAVTLFQEVGTAVGQALAVLVSLLNPELIVIGGGVSRSWKLMESGARAGMERWSQPEAVKRVRVVPSRLGVHAGILGAAAAAGAISEHEGGLPGEC